MAEPANRLPEQHEKRGMPARRDEWGPFHSLRREIDRLFDDVHLFDWHAASPRSIFDLEVPKLRRAAVQLAPAMDLIETEKEYLIMAELPGIDENDVDIRLANRTLTIRGEKKEEKKKKERDYYVSERSFGSFGRSFQLPDGIDAERIEASFAKGVLTVKLPKTDEAQKAEKKIGIKAA